MSEEINNLEDLCDYITKYSNLIYVRVCFEGKWQSKALAELSGKQAIEEALKFIKQGRIPTRMVLKK